MWSLHEQLGVENKYRSVWNGNTTRYYAKSRFIYEEAIPFYQNKNRFRLSKKDDLDFATLTKVEQRCVPQQVVFNLWFFMN